MFTISTFKYGLFDIKHCVSLIYVFVLTTTCSQSVSSRISWEYNNHNKLLNLKSNAALLCLEAKLYEPDYVLSIHFYYAFINKKNELFCDFILMINLTIHVSHVYQNLSKCCFLPSHFFPTFLRNECISITWIHTYVLYLAGKSSTL